jgi:hypothetical protein
MNGKGIELKHRFRSILRHPEEFPQSTVQLTKEIYAQI